MCFAASNVTNLERWNWDGDVIVHQPIVPSGRRVVGVRSRRSYNIDVREYLTSRHNAVMEQVVRENIPRYLRKCGGSVARFDDTTPGSQHCLYHAETTDESDRTAYANQLRWRKNTAILHVRKVFRENFDASQNG